jgi:hypothetical protein
MTDHSDDVAIDFVRIDADQYPPSEACLRFMAAEGYDPHMPVFQASLTPEGMLKLKAGRPDAANYLQLLVGPFGIVDPSRGGVNPFRVAVVRVGDNVIDVEAEYQP